MDTEIIPVVNTEDKIIKYKRRCDINHNDIDRSSGLIIYYKEKILLSQRANTKQDEPNLWSISCTGTVRLNESYIQNIKRETEEELGLTGPTFKAYGKYYIDDGRYKYWFHLFTISIKPTYKFKILDQEITQIKWINVKKLIKELITIPQKYSLLAHIILPKFIYKTYQINQNKLKGTFYLFNGQHNI